MANKDIKEKIDQIETHTLVLDFVLSGFATFANMFSSV